MIDFLEIRNTERETIGIIDTAKSIIWKSVYYGVGDFEIYAQATEQHKELLQVGNYVTRHNNVEIGIIEKINVGFTVNDGYMITASGRFAKSILDRRLIYDLNGSENRPTIISGNVEAAVRSLITKNAITVWTAPSRKISILDFAPLKGLTPVIVDENGNAAEKQVSYQNLLEYTDKVLQEYQLSSRILFDSETKKLLYEVFEGADRSITNTDDNDPVIFSVDYDNLVSLDYSYDEQNLKNKALIGGAGEGLDRIYTTLTGEQEGLELREVFVDASSINKKYKDSSGTEQEYTFVQYRELLRQNARTKLKELIVEETFSGEINATFGTWKINRDYYVGDIVTVQDNEIGKYINTRITEVTEVQDENGYKIDVVFGD